MMARRRHYSTYFDRPKGMSSRSSKRKVGNLLAIQDEPESRVARGEFVLSELRQTMREVYSVCFPQKDFVQTAIPDYLAPWQGKGTYAWYIKDTNSLLQPRGAANYARPGQNLCPPGYVPVTWLYSSSNSSMRNAFGMLTISAVQAARRELAQMAGGDLERIEVMVMPVWIKKPPAEPAPPPPPPRVHLPLGPIAKAFSERSKEVVILRRRADMRRRSLIPVVPTPSRPDDGLEKRHIMVWGIA